MENNRPRELTEPEKKCCSIATEGNVQRKEVANYVNTKGLFLKMCESESLRGIVKNSDS